jgi:hypothetical protein
LKGAVENVEGIVTCSKVLLWQPNFIVGLSKTAKV